MRMEVGGCSGYPGVHLAVSLGRDEEAVLQIQGWALSGSFALPTTESLLYS